MNSANEPKSLSSKKSSDPVIRKVVPAFAVAAPVVAKNGETFVDNFEPTRACQFVIKILAYCKPYLCSSFSLFLFFPKCVFQEVLTSAKTPHPENKKCPKFHVFSSNPSLIMMIKADVMMVVLTVVKVPSC